MMTPMRRVAALALLIGVAAPALAQPAPPPPEAGGRPLGGPGFLRRGPGPLGGNAFQSLSEAGRTTIREAMRSAADDRRAEHDAVKAARDRMLAVLDADRLDTAALRRAMDDERQAANAGRERIQAAMLAGFSRLSTADRKAFVAESRQLRDRVEGRVRAWRDRRGRRGGDDLAPPPPGF